MAPILDGTLVPGVRGTFADVRVTSRNWEAPEADLVALLQQIRNTREGDKSTPVGDVKFMSDAWWEDVQWAVKEADRCGVDIVDVECI